MQRVSEAIIQGKTHVIDLDLRSYFDTVRHHIVLEKVAKRVNDDDVMHLLKMILKASGKRGVPQGGVISPLLSNLYLNEVDRMLERAKEVTRYGRWTAIEYARFADDLVVLVDCASASSVASGGGGEATAGGVGQAPGGGERGEEPDGGPEREERASDSWGLSFVECAVVRGKWMPLADAAAEEAHGAAAEAQGRASDAIDPSRSDGLIAEDQSDPAGLGELLRGRALESVLLVHPKLGGEEDSATPGASPIASGLRLEAVE